MFRRFRYAMARFMYGRYGTDALYMFLLAAAVVLSLLNTLFTAIFRTSPVFTKFVSPLLMLLVFLLLGFGLFRAFSRNLTRRRAENRAIQKFWNRLWDRKNRYFSCPICKQTVRVPRKRGKISIRCPKCGERFIRKT